MGIAKNHGILGLNTIYKICIYNRFNSWATFKACKTVYLFIPSQSSNKASAFFKVLAKSVFFFIFPIIANRHPEFFYFFHTFTIVKYFFFISFCCFGCFSGPKRMLVLGWTNSIWKMLMQKDPRIHLAAEIHARECYYILAGH